MDKPSKTYEKRVKEIQKYRYRTGMHALKSYAVGSAAGAGLGSLVGRSVRLEGISPRERALLGAILGGTAGIYGGVAHTVRKTAPEGERLRRKLKLGGKRITAWRHLIMPAAARLSYRAGLAEQHRRKRKYPRLRAALIGGY